MTAASHPPSDPELLARYLRDGCERSFAALVDAHQRMVLGTALRRTGDAGLARDVAQHHPLWSSDGSRYILLHRWTQPEGRQLTRLITGAKDGTDLRIVISNGYASHFIW